VKTLDKQLDAAVAEHVKRRDTACLSCGRRHALQAAHVFGRRHRATRWLPDNFVTLCAYCHRAEHQDAPGLVRAVALKRLGEAEFDALTRLAHSVRQWTTDEKRGMLRDFLNEKPG
jgi:5-methylcytosine-specific restriction endonuclease McrA